MSTSLNGIRAHYRWLSPHLNNYSFITSQGTGWATSALWITATCLQFRLRSYYKVPIIKSQIYAALVAFGGYAIYTIADIASIYFFNPPDMRTLSTKQLSNSYLVTEEDNARSTIDVEELYHYEPLKEDVCTRLLLLHPAWKHEAPITGDLVDFPFDTPISYSALSYTWGNHASTEVIQVNGKKLAVTYNCAAALRDLRLPLKGRMVWVDAICIDQQNEEERDEQLQYMRTIYNGASETVVHMSDGSSDSSLAFRYARLYAKGVYMPGRIGQWFESKVRNKIHARGHQHVIEELVAIPWMSRIWTVQELAMGKFNRVMLLCKPFECSFDHLSYSITRLLTFMALVGTYPMNGMLSTVKLAARTFPRLGMNMAGEDTFSVPLSETLYRLQTHSASDPKDRIYGLLALFDWKGIKLPQPTYAKSVGQIYCDATIAIAQHERSLNILAFCSGFRSPDMGDVPTWVPDFRTPATPRRFGTITRRATLDSESSVTFLFDGVSLATSAAIIDRVHKVSNHTLWQPSADGYFLKDSVTINLESGAKQTILAFLDWLSMAIDDQLCIPSDPPTLVFQETLLQSTPMPRVPREEFDNWIQLLLSVDENWHAQISDSQPDPADNEDKDKIEDDNDDDDGPFRPRDIWPDLKYLALSNPELQAKFFNKDAPLRHLVDDEYWQLMCMFKTIPKMKQLYHYIWSMNQDAKFFVTENGRMGTGTMGIEEGDVIVLMPGLRTPIALREVMPSVYGVVGTVYVHDLMDGSFWGRLVAEGVDRLQMISLI